jgi:hypothetical protein
METVTEPFNNAAAAPQVLPTARKVGNELDTFQDFKTAMDTWAVAGRFGIGFTKSDRKQNVRVCRHASDCVSNVRAAWTVDLEKIGR